MFRLSALIIPSLITFTSTCSVADFITFTDPNRAGNDFQIQGEYVGQAGDEIPIGIQVIASGNHEFEGVLYTGGLPGTGWDQGTVFHVKGKTTDRNTVFHGVHGERLKFPNSNFHGTIRDGEFQGQAQMFRNQVDDVTFRLKKVHRVSPTLGSRPPTGAVVLFDGTNVNEWKDARFAENSLLDVGTTSKREFGSMAIHLEFRCPFMPTARGMKRGNSGVYVKREWEVQIVDSFGWHHENRKFERLSKFGRCGGIHEMVPPRINMSFPPLSWQTYDIEFTMARFDSGGQKTHPATMTVRHNGILIHQDYVLPPVPAGYAASETKEHLNGPVFLQDHGNPVRYRNIWVIERTDTQLRQ